MAKEACPVAAVGGRRGGSDAAFRKGEVDKIERRGLPPTDLDGPGQLRGSPVEEAHPLSRAETTM